MEGFGRRSQSHAQTPTRRAAKADGDNRFAPRKGANIPAQIYFDGTVRSVPCIIRDMSTTGAKLELTNGWDNPFKSEASEMSGIRLVVRQDRVMYDCKIVRRGETQLGVKFTSAPKPITKAVR